MLVYALYSRGFDDDDILEWMESSANCESAYWCAEYVNERQRTRNIIFIVSARCFVAVRRSLSSRQRYQSFFWAARIPSSPKILWDDITWKTSVFIFTRINFLFTTRSVASPFCFYFFCDDFMVNKCDSTSHCSSFARALRFLLISLVDLTLFSLLLDRCCCAVS